MSGIGARRGHSIRLRLQCEHWCLYGIAVPDGTGSPSARSVTGPWVVGAVIGPLQARKTTYGHDYNHDEDDQNR